MIIVALVLAVRAGAADATARAVHIVLVGDSTVTEHAGWGAAFAAKLRPDVRCSNAARGGASTKSYRKANLWTQALALRPTHVLIQFGHNDMPGKGPERETDAATTFRENLAAFVAEARAAGAEPILVSSVVRRNFENGEPVDLLAGYAAGAKAVAERLGVPFVDLHARSLAEVRRLGAAGSAELGPMKDGKRDNTHFSPAGAVWAADLVIADLRRAVPASAAWFK
jgi:pectinesterase